MPRGVAARSTIALTTTSYPDMNAYIDTMIFIGLYFAGVVLILFIGGLLVQTDLYRASAERRGKYYPQSRIIKDLRLIQQTMIEFVAASDPSRALLQRLAGSEQPVPLRKLLDNISARGTRWTALLVMRVARLVRFMWRGIGLTDVGREVLARMSGGTTVPRHDTLNVLERASDLAKTSPATGEAENAKEGMSSLPPVMGARDRKDHNRFSEPAATTRFLRTNQLRMQTEAGAANAETSSPAIITPADYRELTAAIVAAKKLAWQGQTRVLQEKLAHAVIARGGNLPPDVITMNTRAELVDLATNESLELTLVFPIDAKFEEGRISVFDALGAAMLGRRVGDRFYWAVPYRERRVEVRAIQFQPEIALKLAA
jgi:regulator of nucleoside diphosphate kinase